MSSSVLQLWWFNSQMPGARMFLFLAPGTQSGDAARMRHRRVDETYDQYQCTSPTRHACALL